MSQNIGWIKLHRNIRYSFSNDRKLNRDLYDLYVYLASEASYQDGLLQTKGQIITTSTKLQRDWFHNWYAMKIHRYLKRLHQDGWIILSKPTQRDQDGYCIEICSFDTLSGKTKITNKKDSCFDSVITEVSQCYDSVIDNHTESLQNNTTQLSKCYDSVMTVLPKCYDSEVFLYREEEKEEEKEEEELKQGQDSSVDEPPPTKLNSTLKKKKSKTSTDEIPVDTKPVIAAYHDAYLSRYGVKPIINGMIIKQARQLISRLKETEKAIEIVKFYLTHNNMFYLKNAHAFKFCLSDCEKLHTEYMKNDYIFNKDAKKVEETTANSLLLEQLLARNRKERNE